jgi:molybdopterin converting factor small subunit
MIEVRLFATFREGRQKIIEFDANQYQKASDITEYLHIASEEVAICLINGRHSRLNEPVKDQDVIALFPPVGGG